MLKFLRDKAYEAQWLVFKYDEIVFQIEKRASGPEGKRRVVMNDQVVHEFTGEMFAAWKVPVDGVTRHYMYKKGISSQGDPPHSVAEVHDGVMKQIFPSPEATTNVF